MCEDKKRAKEAQENYDEVKNTDTQWLRSRQMVLHSSPQRNGQQF